MNANDVYPSLYSLTGDIKDINTLLVPAAQLDALNADALYLIYFDDAAMRPEVVIGGLAARQRFKAVSWQWNAHLFGKLESNSRDGCYFSNNISAARLPAAPVVNEWSEAPMTQDQFNAWFDALPWYIRSMCTPNHLIQAAPVVQLSAQPSGWKLVPIEPTADQLNAAMTEGFFRQLAIRVWDAMLASAPATPKDSA